MISRIHVNQHIIRANSKTGARQAVFSVKRGGKTLRSNSVVIDGPSHLVYSPDKPLKCRAKVWIETTSPVILEGA